jgi:hypothetical protein
MPDLLCHRLISSIHQVPRIKIIVNLSIYERLQAFICSDHLWRILPGFFDAVIHVSGLFYSHSHPEAAHG